MVVSRRWLFLFALFLFLRPLTSFTTQEVQVHLDPNSDNAARRFSDYRAAYWNAHDGKVNEIAISPNGNNLVAVTESGRIVAWKLGTNSRDKTIDISGLKEPILDVEFLNNSRFITASSDGIIRGWTLEHDKQLFSLDSKSSYLTNVVVADNLWYVQGFGHVFVASVEETIEPKVRCRSSFDVSPDFQAIAVGSNYYRIELFDTSSDRRLRSIELPLQLAGTDIPPNIRWISFAPNGKELLIVANSRSQSRVLTFNLQSSKLTNVAIADDAQYKLAEYSPCGEIIVAAGYDLRVWRANDKMELFRINGPTVEMAPPPIYFTSIEFRNGAHGLVVYAGCKDGKVLELVIPKQLK